MANSEHQITTHVTSAERAEFTTYARKFHLDAAGLLALLFAKEMRVGRLRALIGRDAAPDDTRDAKVTFRPGAEAHAEITAFVEEAGERISRVGAAIIRAELDERWLEKACPTRNESRKDV